MKELLKPFVAYLLRQESILVLRRYKPKIIAITGTVGKTSTREAIYAVLKDYVNVRQSPKSFNSDFGVPLTILGQKAPSKITDLVGWLQVIIEGLIVLIMPHHYPQWLVLEVGTDRPGDIEAITKWLKPDVVVVTKLSKTPVHVENFQSPEHLFKEKGYLVRALKPGGTLVLNADDEEVMKYKEYTAETVVTFSKGKDYEIVYDNDKPVGISFTVKGTPVVIKGTLGRQHVEHVSAAMTVAKAVGEDLALAAGSLSRITATPGRVRLIAGINGSTIIDDTYNSSPIAVEEALRTLKSVKAKRRIAVLGDMLELGRYSADAHRLVGEQAAKSAGLLATVGLRSRATAEAALAAGLSEKKVLQFDSSREAGSYLKDLIKEGDVVLVKGSQGIRMERVVEELMAEPKQKAKLLVRQGEEWKDR